MDSRDVDGVGVGFVVDEGRERLVRLRRAVDLGLGFEGGFGFGLDEGVPSWEVRGRVRDWESEGLG